MPPAPLQQLSPGIDLGQLRSQLGKKLGPERAHHYFRFLNRFLGQKLSKAEFDKLCYATIGRENIPLHNKLIRSIIKNAYQAKDPPPLRIHGKDITKPVGATGIVSPTVDDGFCQRTSWTAPGDPVWSNGVLPPSPRRRRSGFREPNLKDRPSVLRPNWRVNLATDKSPCDNISIRENGFLKSLLLQHQTPRTEKPSKRPRVDLPSQHNWVTVHKKGQPNAIVAEGGRAKVPKDANSWRASSSAPLGIPFCSASVGGSQGPSPVANFVSDSDFDSNRDSGELCPTEAIKKRMECIAEAQGLGAVMMDCANVLNSGLDAYMKRLISSCIQMVGNREGYETENHVHRQQPHGLLTNSMSPVNHMHIQTSGGTINNPCPISLKDFKVAMELNPQQLGEDWPFLLERICFRCFEE